MLFWRGRGSGVMLVLSRRSGERGMLTWWMGILCPCEVRKYSDHLLLLD